MQRCDLERERERAPSSQLAMPEEEREKISFALVCASRLWVKFWVKGKLERKKENRITLPIIKLRLLKIIVITQTVNK